MRRTLLNVNPDLDPAPPHTAQGYGASPSLLHIMMESLMNLKINEKTSSND